MAKRIERLSICILFFLQFISWSQAQSLPEVKPEEVGMSSVHLELLNSAVKEALGRKDFPGAVILVARRGKVVWRKAYGESQWVPSHEPMMISMIFDLASLTKPIATATSIMILVEEGKISLWDKVKNFIPEFSPYVGENETKGKDARIWHLLTHTSGLPPYADVTEIERKNASSCDLNSLIKRIARLEKTNPPGEAFHYSCLGYITLALILEKITGETIAEFSERNIFYPLKMTHTFFVPSEEFRKQCVPTEVIKGKPLRGIVHDPLARLQGGISGNAGLFSTVDDLAVFAQMMLNKGEFNGARILSPLTVERMTEVFPEVSFSGRGLGWDINSEYSTNGGDIFGRCLYGHTGYTGTSTCIDPETETFVIFLTNRVHPDDKGAIVSLRSKVANIVASSIER